MNAPEELRKTLDDIGDLKPEMLEEQMEYLKSLWWLYYIVM
jgi:hypothetical protein